MSSHIQEGAMEDPITLLFSRVGDLHQETRCLMDAKTEVFLEIENDMLENKGLAASQKRWCKDVDNVVEDAIVLQNSFESIDGSYTQSTDLIFRVEKLLKEVRRLHTEKAILFTSKNAIPDPIILLSSMAHDLSEETRYLTITSTKVLEEVERGMRENKRRTPFVETWCEEVSKVVDDVREFQDSFISFDGLSPKSRHQLRCTIEALLKEVRRLQTQITSLVIEGETMQNQEVLLENPTHTIFGMEDYLTKVYCMLDDNSYQIIGIYGVGGIGKTTLLKEINTQLHHTKSEKFDLVIFITVSKDVNIEEIQKDISYHLGYSEYSKRSLPMNPYERTKILFKALHQKKFLLLLDDLSKKLDLNMVGIPLSSHSNKGSKIVFTTQSEEVCNDMGTLDNKVRVHQLSEISSWQLFCEKMGKTSEEDWNGSTNSLAKELVGKCGGLPLALIILGRAMTNATTDVEWKEALMMLEGVTVELTDVTNVLILLSFCFHKLKDKHHKECLLYCALYPEDHSIEVDKLVDSWVGEGFLEKTGDSIYSARSYGHSVITALKAACFLEDGNPGIGSNTVKLHNIVHKMVLWITPEKGKYETVFLSNSGKHLVRSPTLRTYSTRISLLQNRIIEMRDTPYCPNLRTLMLGMNRSLAYICRGFFQSMPHLTVLDLSSTKLTILPSDIGLLHELQYLDLSDNPSLQSLPKEVWGLKKLRMLNLNFTGLKIIPREAMSLFSSLQLLKINMTMHIWRGGWKEHDNEIAKVDVCLKDLDGLRKLEELDLEIQIKSLEDLCGLHDSHKLRSVFTSLSLMAFDIFFFEFHGNVWTPNQLRKLEIRNCYNLKKLVFPANQVTKVKEINLVGCPIEKIDWKDGRSILKEPSTCTTFKNLLSINFWNLALQDITWTRKLPYLQTLRVSHCNKMMEMITVAPKITQMDSERDSFFPALRSLYVGYMRNLRSICRKPLLFPSLEYLLIKECSMVKKLPFQLESCKNPMLIRGDITWWNELEWDDKSVELKFNTYFEVE